MNVLVTGFTPVGEPSISNHDAKYISDVFFSHFQAEIDALGAELESSRCSSWGREKPGALRGLQRRPRGCSRGLGAQDSGLIW